MHDRMTASARKGELIMKRLTDMLRLAAVLVLTLGVAAPATANKPLYGEMDLHWNNGFEDASGECPAISWAGNIDIDGTWFGMTFVPTSGRDTGKAFHFVEDWAIYDGTFDFSEDFSEGVLTECAPGDVVLAGEDFGVTGWNDKYRMNGTVSTAEDPFEDWMGRRVHMNGLIVWNEADSSLEAPGTFRLN